MHLLLKLFPAISGENASSGAGFHAFLTAFFSPSFRFLGFSWFLFLGTNFLPFSFRFFRIFYGGFPFLTSSFCTTGIFYSCRSLFFFLAFGLLWACALLSPGSCYNGEIVKRE